MRLLIEQVFRKLYRKVKEGRKHRALKEQHGSYVLTDDEFKHILLNMNLNGLDQSNIAS